MASFDLDFEDEILSQCLRDKDYIKTATTVVESHHFGTEHRGWVWDLIQEVWTDSAELLTPKVALRRARADFKDDEERVVAVELAGKLFKLTPESPRAALNELGKFVRFARLSSSMEDAVRHLDKGAVDEAYQIITQISGYDRRAADKWEVCRWIEEFGARLIHQKHVRDNPDLYPAIRTGIKGLDRVIDGIRSTEMGIVAATTSRGKSIFATHLGFHSIKQECGVVDFRTEMSAAQVAMRYDSRWTRMVHSKFKHFDFNADEIRVIKNRLVKATAKYQGLLRIISMPVTTATLPKMKRAVEEQRDEMRNIKLIILDSSDHIRAEDSYKDFRFETAGVYWDIAGWAVEAGLSIWCTAQLGKQAVDRMGESEDLSEAYDKSRIADILVTINQPKNKSRATPKVMVGEDDDDHAAERVKRISVEGSGDLVLKLSKYRDGLSKMSIPLQTDLKRMLIRDADAD